MPRFKSFKQLIRRVLLRLAVLLLIAAASEAQEPPAAETTPDGNIAEVAPVPAPTAEEAVTPAPEDTTAAYFVNRCAGCHTIGGAGRSGPDLLPASTWAVADLRASVKRMEKSAGPMKDAEIDGLVEFLKDSSAKDRIATEEARRRVLNAASLEPASVSKGHALFFGKASFANGGSNCAACHAVSGRGGNLGLDLTSVFDRFGETALSSAIEKSSFLVMKPIYEKKPITRQEAAHLTAFFESEAIAAKSGGARSFSPPVGMLGTMLAAGMIAVLAVAGIRRRPGTRARLLAEANRR